MRQIFSLGSRAGVAACVAVILACLVAPLPTSAQVGVPVVKLTMTHPEFGGADSQMLRFQLTNPTDRELTILKWFTPLDGVDDDMFAVERQGNAVMYLGKMVKRGPPGPEDYVTLRPGQTVTADVDLGANYDIHAAGEYRVEYTGALLQVGTESPWEMAQQFADAVPDDCEPVEPRGNKVTWFRLDRERASRNLIPKEAFDEQADTAVSDMTEAAVVKNCSADRVAVIRKALGIAIHMARTASADLKSAPPDQQSKAKRYSLWFGPHDPSRYGSVKAHFAKILDALTKKRITCNCHCPKHPRAFAYVFAARPYEIFLCEAFWKAQFTGRDSRGGTIVHETSHFYVVAGTKDFVYGDRKCQALAKKDPVKAIRNADSHEYFAENIERLPMTGMLPRLDAPAAYQGRWKTPEAWAGLGEAPFARWLSLRTALEPGSHAGSEVER